MSFLVSVIIPVYNGEYYIEKAINSALKQPEVNEVVVVNDGSTDGTLTIIEKLQKKDSRVKIYHHKNKKNKGRSASRNLGIKKTSKNYIAFLDADDFYLENRFKNDKHIFEENGEADGVYNAIGVHFYREFESFEYDKLELTTLNKKVNYEDLFDILLSGHEGHFSIDGLTVKKSVFDTVGNFNETLLVAEDTELFFKMALKCRLEAGILNKPLAKRGIHEKNISHKEDLYIKYRTKMFESLLFWGSKNKTPLKIIEKYLDWLWLNRFNKNNNLIKDIFYWVYLTFNSPFYFFSYITVKYFPLVRLRKKIFSFLYRS
jgi:glycosyltransferase involved in cell wall biosynthesis